MNLIVKADTIGVVEAIRSALGALPQESVTLRYLLTGAGDISVSTEYSVWRKEGDGDMGSHTSLLHL